MGTSFDVVQLERDDKRQWHVVGEIDALPGGCRVVAPLRPIILQNEDGSTRVGYASRGFIDSEERFAYVLWRHIERDPDEVVTTSDGLEVSKQ